MSVRVRMAPSPTGYVHIGTARTALFNWLYARHHGEGGVYILRVEDTDRERSTDDAVAQALRVLSWLDLDWDEGPEVGGPHAPYVQSQRDELYARRVRELLDAGKAYPCFCSADDLNRDRDAAIAAGRSATYSGRCRTLGSQERERRLAAGEKYTVRFAVPGGEVTSFTDAVHGESRFENDLIGDFIVQRSDGACVYNFCCVVDDIDMRITHVIRGDDHLSNTPRQVLLYEAFGEPLPTFAHAPMILGPDKKKLSKRHGAASVDELAEAGYLPAAVVNYLALLGWSKGDDSTVMTVDEMVEAFDIVRVNKSPAAMDYEKLRWVNGQHLRMIGLDEYAAAYDVWRRRWLPVDDPLHAAAFAVTAEDAALLAQQKVETFRDVPEFLSFMVDDGFQIGDDAWQRLVDAPGADEVLAVAVDSLSDLSDWSVEGTEVALRALCETLGQKPRTVFGPLRFALTGKTVAPGLFETVSVLGRDRTLARLEAASSRLSAAAAPSA